MVGFWRSEILHSCLVLGEGGGVASKGTSTAESSVSIARNIFLGLMDVVPAWVGKVASGDGDSGVVMFHSRMPV